MEEVQLIKHTHMGIVSSLHVLNVHIQYLHYTYTYSKNFARLIANLLFHAEGVLLQTKMSSESSAGNTAAFLFLFILKSSLIEKKKGEKREPGKSSYLIKVRCF